MWSTSFEYYIYYIIFWHISFFCVISLTTSLLLFYSAYTIMLDPHIVYSSHIHNISVVLTTDKLRLFEIVIVITSPSIASLTLLSSSVSALFWNFEHFCLMYVININTHVLLFFLYYFVVPIALLWNKGRGFNQYSYYCYLFQLGPA